jgi:hypothetical protein
MSRRAAFLQADVKRLVKGALAAGLPADSFVVKVVGDELQLLPIAANPPSDDAAEMARRMREAFGG